MRRRYSCDKVLMGDEIMDDQQLLYRITLNPKLDFIQLRGIANRVG